ncbi:MEDS domain-containing protein [Halocatena marina]|uniref:MEDS domain-containing protein n=1 Tax=Halocatena marina TaxID=2934937 RepID=A0ABD5YR88_9EURY|nr:MEDS domain-containing protein [Halocatena marina]
MAEHDSDHPETTLNQCSAPFGSISNHPNHSACEANDHFALLYETHTQQFSTVIPFIQEGLEQNEYCLYIVDDNTEADVVTAMRAANINVDAVRESGQLSIHTSEELCLKSSAFDQEAAIDFWKQSFSTARKNGYGGIRGTGEMTWILDSEITPEELRAYENKLNTVCSSQGYVGLCQYNRSRFPPDVCAAIVNHHPKFVYNDTSTENFYYIPPGGEFDSERSNDPCAWQLSTLVERTKAEKALRRREQGLKELDEATRKLMCADANEITEWAADLARAVLNVEFTSFWPYNKRTGELELKRSSTELQTDVTALAELYETRAWGTFITEQTETLDHLKPPQEQLESEAPLRSGVIVPVGRHGIFCAGSTHQNRFDDMTVNLAKMIGANIETALDRAERERALNEQTIQLERVNRINSIIRRTINAIVDADPGAEIEQIVCERLAASPSYQFVWIGKPDLETGRITPSAWSGGQSGYLDRIVHTTDDTVTRGDPIGSAARTQTVQVVQDVLTDPGFKQWREQTLTEGFRACISIPLVYEESFYGVLNLYTDTPNAFSEREQTVLGELGETIAHSINAAETKRTLQASSAIELKLNIPNSDDVLARIARDTDCQIELEEIVPLTNDLSYFFFRTEDASTDNVLASGKQQSSVGEIHIIKDKETNHLFEAVVTKPTIASCIVDNEATIRSLTITDQNTTVIVELPSTVTVREFLEALRTNYPDTELVARRPHGASASAPEKNEVQKAVAEQLTNRQREVIETAYMSGFFESPRARTGSDLSTELGISQSTFSHHLREAERKLCEIVLENA